MPTNKKSDLLAAWKNRTAKKQPAQHPVIPSRPEGVVVPATEGQQRLWVLQQLNPENNFYQYVHAYTLEGPFVKETLRRSFQLLIERREILRTNFVKSATGVEMVVRPPKTFSFEEIKTRKDHQQNQDDTISTTHTATTAWAASRDLLTKKKAWARELIGDKVDLAKDRLLKASLIELGPGKYLLLLSIHHIIGDRGSLLELEKELFSLYRDLAEERTPELPPLEVQFPDYAYWLATKDEAPADLSFWLDQLSVTVPVVDLSADHARPQRPTFRGETISLSLHSSLAAGIRELSRQYETTPNVVLLAAFQLLQHRYAAAEDVWVGSPVSIRDQQQTERMIGFLNTTLVFPSKLEAGKTTHFGDFVDRLKSLVVRGLSPNRPSYDKLVAALEHEWTGGWNPLFQTMFVFDSVPPQAALSEGLTVTDEMIDLGTAKFDLTLFAAQREDTFELSLEYARDLFENETAKNLLEHYVTLLEGIVANPDIPLLKLPLLNEAGYDQQIVHWNNTGELVAEHFITAFRKAAQQSPMAIAVSGAGAELTYRELYEKANKLAQRLIDKGVVANEIIGLYGHRHPDTIAGMLGIMFAGAAYLPLDPEYPEERIRFMMEDSGASRIVNQTKDLPPVAENNLLFAINSPGEEVGASTDFQVKETTNDQLAYVIYTSGSTGKPKGVPVSHGNLAWSNTSRKQFFDESPDCFLLLSSFSFDSSVAGIFWTLSSGGKLLLSAKRAEQDPGRLAELIRTEKVTHSLMLPSLYQLLLEYGGHDALAGLITVMVAGEACSSRLVDQHFTSLPQTKLVNEYGPTEATVWSTAHKIRPMDSQAGVPIGKPIPGVKNYILDAQLQLLPVGVSGELFVAGPNVVNGYLLRPELTKDRFLANPYEDGKYGRLYRTGDRVRYRRGTTEGLIEFLGRSDNQVKIRGYRVEPEEIASRIGRLLPEIKEASVIALRSADEELYLAAYFTAQKTANIGEQDVRQLLLTELPAYMVPEAILRLDEFPRLPNGKIDRSKLPEIKVAEITDGVEFLPPQSELEKQLATIWEKVLKLDKVGQQTDFFNAGGDSMKSIRVIGEARKIGIRIQPRQLFEQRTLQKLADAVDPVKLTKTLSEESHYDAIVPLKSSGWRAPLFCLHSGGGHVFFYQPLAELMPQDRPLYAIQPKGLEGGTDSGNFTSIPEMAEYYLTEIRRIQPEGPYNLLGTCFSNAVALEIVRLLEDADEKVENLFIIDSAPAHLENQVAPHLENRPLINFFNALKRGDWSYLFGRLKKRLIIAGWLVSSINQKEKRSTYETILGLNELYSRHHWKPIEGDISFIRSSEFAGRADKESQPEQWRKLVKGNVQISVVEGEHLTLFKQPFVKGLAARIAEELVDEE